MMAQVTGTTFLEVYYLFTVELKLIQLTLKLINKNTKKNIQYMPYLATYL